MEKLAYPTTLMRSSIFLSIHRRKKGEKKSKIKIFFLLNEDMMKLIRLSPSALMKWSSSSALIFLPLNPSPSSGKPSATFFSPLHTCVQKSRSSTMGSILAASMLSTLQHP